MKSIPVRVYVTRKPVSLIHATCLASPGVSSFNRYWPSTCCARHCSLGQWHSSEQCKQKCLPPWSLPLFRACRKLKKKIHKHEKWRIPMYAGKWKIPRGDIEQKKKILGACGEVTTWNVPLSLWAVGFAASAFMTPTDSPSYRKSSLTSLPLTDVSLLWETTVLTEGHTHFGSKGEHALSCFGDLGSPLGTMEYAEFLLSRSRISFGDGASTCITLILSRKCWADKR